MRGATESPSDVSLRLNVLEGRLAICRLDAGEEVPTWATAKTPFSVTRTPEELSIVCPEGSVPEGVTCERGWRALVLEGPMDFSLVGVLASVARPLAEAGVSIFSISTYDTDHVLVREEALDAAVAALRRAGHEVRGPATSFVVRPAAADEEPFLWEMLYEAVHWGPEESGPKPRSEKLLKEPGLRRYLEGWGREGDFAVVALDVDGGGRIGAAWFRLFSASEPGYGFVDEKTPELAVAVAGGWRGRGVGGALLAALTDTARTNGFHALSLSVQKSNPAAGLYGRVGFVEIRDEGDDWIMKADLTGSKSPSDAWSAQRTEER
jgi:GNAT superfamily N-acetyltransferase